LVIQGDSGILNEKFIAKEGDTAAADQAYKADRLRILKIFGWLKGKG
jgi:hypothetical protein